MKALISILMTVIPSFAYAQNIVPNPSFEVYDTCPDYFGQWYHLLDWESIYTQSADYFNECSINPHASVPSNTFGYQQAYDGIGYAGIATFVNNVPLVRENLVVELDQPLIVGSPVFISFKVAVGGFGESPLNSAVYTAKGVGIKFFVNVPLDLQTYLYPNSAAVYLDTALTDTAIWHTVNGTYIPDSNYRHLVIANFFEDVLSDTMVLDSSGFGNFPAAYSFIDDVCVSFSPTECDMVDAVHEQELTRSQLYPNPANDKVFIQWSVPMERQIRIYDLIGSLVWQGTTNGLRFSWDVSKWPRGQYFVEERNGVNQVHKLFLF